MDALWDHARYCDETETEIARLAEALAAADPAVPVPGCPDWTSADLAEHVGTVHRWCAHIVATGATARIPFGDVPVDEVPGEDRSSWILRGGERLLTTLRAADPDAPLWSWGADQHVRFWSRRMFHESAVHRADAERAAGRTPVFDPAAAGDGIEEFLVNISTAGRARKALAAFGGAGETLHLHATGSDGEWMITLEPAGLRWERGHGKGTVAVQGDAGDLLLLVHGRISPDGLTVFGDRDLLDRWLAASRF